MGKTPTINREINITQPKTTKLSNSYDVQVIAVSSQTFWVMSSPIEQPDVFIAKGNCAIWIPLLYWDKRGHMTHYAKTTETGTQNPKIYIVPSHPPIYIHVTITKHSIDIIPIVSHYWPVVITGTICFMYSFHHRSKIFISHIHHICT